MSKRSSFVNRHPVMTGVAVTWGLLVIFGFVVVSQMKFENMTLNAGPRPG